VASGGDKDAIVTLDHYTNPSSFRLQKRAGEGGPGGRSGVRASVCVCVCYDGCASCEGVKLWVSIEGVWVRA